jgi:CBS domain containing-hemolysin-like protein
VIVLDLQRLRGAGAWVLAAASLGPLLVLILTGEVVPKMVGMLVAERWAVTAAAPLTVLRRAFSGVIRLLQAALVSPLVQIFAPVRAGGSDISSDELAALLDLSARRGTLDRQVNVLLQEIVELADLRVRDIMVPRVDMISYDVNGPRAGLVKLLCQSRLRRIPVYERNVDNILGVIPAKLVLFQPDTPLRDLVVKVPFVPEAADVERTLLQLRVRRAQMAIVVDEYGGTAGLVTLEDVLEEIVGDIPDRHEHAGPLVEKAATGHYFIDGDLAIHEWADAFDIDLKGRRISSVGGFVTYLLGRIPAAGDAATYRNLKFTVVSMRRRRIGKIEVHLREEGE